MVGKEKLLRLRRLLIRRRDALRSALADELSGLKDQLPSGDTVDWAIDASQDEVNSQLAEVESRELVEIEEALARMESGQYGICLGCGKAIPWSRLEAIPYSTLCIGCRRSSEQQEGSATAAQRWDRISDLAESDLGEPTLDDLQLGSV